MPKSAAALLLSILVGLVVVSVLRDPPVDRSTADQSTPRRTTDREASRPPLVPTPSITVPDLEPGEEPSGAAAARTAPDPPESSTLKVTIDRRGNSIYLTSLDPPHLSGKLRRSLATRDDLAAFEVESLEPGHYTLRVYSKSSVLEHPFEVESGGLELTASLDFANAKRRDPVVFAGRIWLDHKPFSGLVTCGVIDKTGQGGAAGFSIQTTQDGSFHIEFPYLIKGAVDLHLSAKSALDRWLDTSDLDFGHCEIFLESDIGPEVIALDTNEVPLVQTELEFTGTRKSMTTTVEGRFQVPAQASSVQATILRFPPSDRSGFQKAARVRVSTGLGSETREVWPFSTVGRSAAFVCENSKNGRMVVVLERDGIRQACAARMIQGAAYLSGLPESGRMLLLIGAEHLTHCKTVRLEDLPVKGTTVTLTVEDEISWRTVEVSNADGQPVSGAWIQLEQHSRNGPSLNGFETLELPNWVHDWLWRPSSTAGEYAVAELPGALATIRSVDGSALMDLESLGETVQLQPHTSIMGRLTFRDASWLRRLLLESTLEYRLASHVVRTKPRRSGEFCFPAGEVGDGGRIFLLVRDQSFDLGPARIGILTERRIPDSIFEACGYDVDP